MRWLAVDAKAMGTARQEKLWNSWNTRYYTTLSVAMRVFKDNVYVQGQYYLGSNLNPLV